MVRTTVTLFVIIVLIISYVNLTINKHKITKSTLLWSWFYYIKMWACLHSDITNRISVIVDKITFNYLPYVQLWTPLWAPDGSWFEHGLGNLESSLYKDNYKIFSQIEEVSFLRRRLFNLYFSFYISILSLNPLPGSDY